MPRFFTVVELEVMDDLTANNKVVLASLGGAPKPTEKLTPGEYSLERRFLKRMSGIPRRREGSYRRRVRNDAEECVRGR